jgi:two-component system, LytTR family, sensor kinase
MMVKEKEQSDKMKLEKLQWDYTFLKMQVNPHFLHNTLSFLYSRALRHDQELSDGIMALANIMRFALRTEEDGDGKILLQKEVEHIKNVISINQFRNVNKLHISFTETGHTPGVRIVPFVLITILENALKHGDMQCADYPIEVKLDVSEGWINFFCTNRKHGGPLDFANGITLEDIRKRLSQVYGSKYELLIEEDKKNYTVRLKIPV